MSERQSVRGEAEEEAYNEGEERGVEKTERTVGRLRRREGSEAALAKITQVR